MATVSNTIFIKKEFIPLTGSLPAAALLSQICYWAERTPEGKPIRMRIHRFNKDWIAKTRPEWMQETGLTLDQYNRALSKLKNLGLVETKQMIWANIAQTHLHLSVPSLNHWTAKCSAVAIPDTPVLQHPTPQCGNTPHAIYTESTSETTALLSWSDTDVSLKAEQELTGMVPPGIEMKIEDSNNNPCVLTKSAGGPGEKFVKTKNTPAKREALLRDQVMAQNAAKKSSYGDPASKPSMEVVWREGLIKNKQTVIIGVKEKAMLKKLKKDLGEEAHAVLKHCILKWTHFCLDVMHANALSNAPDKPHLGFLLKYRALAMDLYLQSIAQPKQFVEPKESVPTKKSYVPFKGSHADPNPYKPSPEELAEILAPYIDKDE